MSIRPISQISRVGARNPKSTPTNLICTATSKNQRYRDNSPALCQAKILETPSRNILKPYKFKRPNSTVKINPSKIFRFPVKSKRCLQNEILEGISNLCVIKSPSLFQQSNNANNCKTSKAFMHTFKSVSTGIPIKVNNIVKEPKRQINPVTTKKITKIIHFFLNKLRINKQCDDINTEINKLQKDIQSRTTISTKYLHKKNRNSLSLIKQTARTERIKSKINPAKSEIQPIEEICVEKLVKQLPSTAKNDPKSSVYVFNKKAAKQLIEPFIKDAPPSYELNPITENFNTYKCNNPKPLLTTNVFKPYNNYKRKMLPLKSEMAEDNKENYFLSNIRNKTPDTVCTLQINICKPTKLENELKNNDEVDVEMQSPKKNGMCYRIPKHNKNLLNILKTANLHTLDKKVNAIKQSNNNALIANKIYSKTKLENNFQLNKMKQQPIVQKIDNSYENYLNELTSKPISYKKLINIIKADSGTMMELITARRKKEEAQEEQTVENKTCTSECTCRACIEKMTNSIAKTLDLKQIHNPNINAKNIAKRKLGYSTSPRIRYINRVYLKGHVKGRRYYSKKGKDDCSTTPPEVPPIAKCNSCTPSTKQSTTQKIDVKETKRDCYPKGKSKSSKPKSACDMIKPKKKKVPTFKMKNCCPKLRQHCETYVDRPCKKLEAPYNSFSERFAGFIEEDKTECEDLKSKGLQPRNQKSPKILLVEATTPKFSQIDPDLERRCLKDKVCECQPAAIDNKVTYKCKTQFESKECPPRGRKHCEDYKDTTCTKLNAPYKSFYDNCPQFPEVEYTECDLAEKLADATTKDLGKKCGLPPAKSPLEKECNYSTGEPVVKKNKDDAC